MSSFIVFWLVYKLCHLKHKKAIARFGKSNFSFPNICELGTLECILMDFKNASPIYTPSIVLIWHNDKVQCI